MLKSSAVATALCLALALAGPSFLSGCGNSQDELDHAAASAIDAADQQRAKATNLAALDAIQAKYDALATAASLQGLSPQMHIIVRGRQAQLRMERVMRMIDDLRGQELGIARTIDDIEQLALQVAGAQSSIEALRSYDPSAQIAKLKAREADIQGGPDKLTWTASEGGQGTSPTLAKTSADIESLTVAIAANQSDTDQQKRVRLAKINDGEKYSRKSEGESGEAQVKDLTVASEDRRDAAIADAKIDRLGQSLAQLQSNLQKARDEKSALDQAVAMFEAQITALQTGWTSIQAQMQAQQKVEQKIIAGTDGGDALASIVGRAEALARELHDAGILRDAVLTQLNAVISQFGDAAQQAQKVRNDLVAEVRQDANDPDAVIWTQTQETLHPMYYGLQQASAREAAASVAAARTRIDLMINRMFNGYEVSPGESAAQFKLLNVTAGTQPIKIPGITALLNSQKTGIDMPKALADLTNPDADKIKQDEDAVSKLFDEAVEAYKQRPGATDMGPASQERKNIALSGQASTDRRWAEFANATGDSTRAQSCLKDADDAQSQIDPNFRSAAATPADSARPRSSVVQ